MNRRTRVSVLIVGVASACASTSSCVNSEAASRQESIQPARTQLAATPRAEEPEPPHPPSYVPVGIEDPSGVALEHFHAALRRAEAKRGKARILIYGASHTAADIYPDVLRQRLQARFGDAGPGFIMPAKPLRHYSVPGIAFESSLGWSGFYVKTSTVEQDHFGLAGIYVMPNRRRARASFLTRAHAGLSGFASDFELYFWRQPGGGHFRFSLDGKSFELSAAAGKPGPAYRHWSVPETNHRVELSTRGDGPVRIFGLSIERKQPGVIIDTLGIPGARAATQLLWDPALQVEHLRRRHPDLVMLAYGTNEAGDDEQPIEEYAASLRRVLSRIRRAVPKASCVLIGPSDRPIRTPDGYVDRPRTAQVTATQREVAFDLGCGFFDLVSFMGGPLGMLDWCDGEPPFGQNDHVHFTPRGYQTLGNVLHDALLAGYDDHPVPALIGGRSPDEPDLASTATADDGPATLDAATGP